MGSESLVGGWVRIERGRIVGVGGGSPRPPVVDLGDAILLPGLVNAHTHLEFSDLAAPLPAGGGLPEWIGRVVALRRGRGSAGTEATRRDAAIAAGLAESARAGVTAIGEIATGALIGGDRGGPRVRSFREALGLSSPVMAGAGASVVRDLDRGAAPPGHAGISPHAPYSVGRQLGRRLVDEACHRRVPVAMHLAESAEELELLATHGGPFRGLLERIGAWHDAEPPRLLSVEDWITLLSRAPRALVVHGTFLPDLPRALARLARHRRRLCVVVCPRTAASLVGRLPPVATLRRAGIRVALGTDSRASSPDLSVLAEAAVLVDAGATGAEEAIRMATVESAWALGFEAQCGRLAAGRPADLAVLRPPGTWSDPFEAALDPATRVVTTIRGGRVVAGESPW
ncbi:MAG: amidohydrolase family protein [Planctomycetia bacterium]